jgi:uncharacterized protein (DUF885 family)
MDRQTAESEAADFATAPGLAISYEIDKFSLRDFHDYVWRNGNVPLSLQRWELLGLDDEIKKVDELNIN